MDREALRRASLITLRRCAELNHPPGPERDAWLAFWDKVDSDGRFPMPVELRAQMPKRR